MVLVGEVSDSALTVDHVPPLDRLPLLPLKQKLVSPQSRMSIRLLTMIRANRHITSDFGDSGMCAVALSRGLTTQVALTREVTAHRITERALAARKGGLGSIVEDPSNRNA
eukprot:1347716-Amphidinium_carterae.3